jgi:hypothetical protein
LGLGIGSTSSSAVSSSTTDDITTAATPNLIAYDSKFNSSEDYMNGNSSGLFFQAGIGNSSFLENLYEPLGSLGLRLAYKPSFSYKRMTYVTVTLFYTN